MKTEACNFLELDEFRHGFCLIKPVLSTDSFMHKTLTTPQLSPNQSRENDNLKQSVNWFIIFGAK